MENNIDSGKPTTIDKVNSTEVIKMPFIDFTEIVKEAWQAYDNTRIIKRIVDISAKVSTNHVYRITFTGGSIIIGKLSYFGKHEHFVEDHSIINSLSNTLPAPFENFLARSLAQREH